MIRRSRGTLSRAFAILPFVVLASIAQVRQVLPNFHPRLGALAKKYTAQFKPPEPFTIDEVVGGWQETQKVRFDHGGLFDQIYVARR